RRLNLWRVLGLDPLPGIERGVVVADPAEHVDVRERRQRQETDGRDLVLAAGLDRHVAGRGTEEVDAFAERAASPPAAFDGVDAAEKAVAAEDPIGAGAVRDPHAEVLAAVTIGEGAERYAG